MVVIAIMVFFSFFQPWVHINSIAKGALSKILPGKDTSTLQSISGYDVPVLANRKDSKLIMTIAQIFSPNTKDVDKKSWLIWGVPIFAVLLVLLNLIFGANKWVALGTGIIAVAVFAVAVFKISTTELDKVVISVSIAKGLWNTLYGYLGIGILSLLNFIRLQFLGRK